MRQLTSTKMKMKSVLLLVFFIITLESIAQTRAHSLKILDSYTRINIGDTVDQSLLEKALQSVAPSTSFPDIKRKVIILDWWSPYCSPCIAAMPKMDSLQKKFKNKVSIFPLLSVEQINDSTIKDAQKFWDKNRYTRSTSLPLILDTVLYKRFPHDGLPFVVWIDSNLVVRAFTSSERVNSTELSSFLPGTELNWENTNKVLFDYSIPFVHQPLLKEIILNQSNQSIATKYVPRVSTAAGFDSTQESIRYYAVNVPIVKLYRYAIGFIRSKDNPINSKFDSSIFETGYDKRKGGYYEDWKKKMLYSYEINIPKSLTNEERLTYIINDINKLFNLHAVIIQEPTTCLTLEEHKKNSSLKKTPNKFQKADIEKVEVFETVDALIYRLRNGLYTVPVFLSSTAMKTKPPIIIPRTCLNPLYLDKIPAINNYLTEAGYKLNKTTRMYPVLHIR